MPESISGTGCSINGNTESITGFGSLETSMKTGSCAMQVGTGCRGGRVCPPAAQTLQYVVLRAHTQVRPYNKAFSCEKYRLGLGYDNSANFLDEALFFSLRNRDFCTIAHHYVHVATSNILLNIF